LRKSASLASLLLSFTIVAVAPSRVFARGECPSVEPGLTDGIGFAPAEGSQSCWWTVWNNVGAPECATMDLTARPFDGSNADHTAFVDRYGFDRALCGTCHFGVDAETILGAGSVALQNSCCQGVFGTSETHTCYPTLTELHDYAAVNPNWAPHSVHNTATILLNAPSQLAAGQPGNFVAMHKQCSPSTEWTWAADGGVVSSNSRIVTITWATGGTKTVTVTNAGCLGAAGSATVTVQQPEQPAPVASFLALAGCPEDESADCELTTAQTVRLVATGSGGDFSWDFGDGQVAVGSQVEHRWALPGSYLVTHSVTPAGGSAVSTGRTFDVSDPLSRNVVVPWVAGSTTALPQSSDLYLFNAGPGTALVDITFRRRGIPLAQPPRASRTLAAGATLQLENVFAQLGIAPDTGFLTIASRGDSPLPGVPAPQLAVVSINRTLGGGDSFGQAVNALFVDPAVAGGPAAHHLIGLSETKDRTAYLGLSNVGQAAALYHLTFYARDGRQIATTRNGSPQVLAAQSQKQLTSAALRALGVAGATDYRVVVETITGGPVYPFAATRRVATGDPSYVAGQRDAARARQYVVGVLTGKGAEGSLWASDLLLANPTAQALTATLRFVPVGVGAPSAARVKSVPAGQTLRLVDVLKSEWGLASARGVLVVDGTTAGSSGLVVAAETYDRADAKAIYGQTMAPLAIAEAATSGLEQALVGLRQDTAYRTVVWLYNPGATPASVGLVYRAIDGAELGRGSIAVPAGATRQLGGAQHLLPAGFSGPFSLELEVGSGALLSAAQVVDNRNNDPAYTAGITTSP
jgi:hypothetical protein